LDLGLLTEKVIMKKMNYYAEGIQKFERYLALELSSLVDLLKAVQKEPHKDREPTTNENSDGFGSRHPRSRLRK
jgi:hypothetical protein